MMKFLRRSLLAFIVFAGMLLLAAVFIVNTNQGLSWILTSIEVLSNQHFSFKQVSGGLTGTVTIGKITYHTNAIDVKIQTAKFKFEPAELLNFRLVISLVSAQSINITQTLSDKTNNKPLKIPKLPWFFDIQSAKIQQLTYQNNHSDKLSLSLSSSFKNTAAGLSGTLSLTKLQGQIQQKPFSGNLDLRFFPKGFTLHNSTLQFGNAILSIDGGLNKTWNALWSLDIKNVSDALDIPTNVLHIKGNISGAQTTPTIHIPSMSPISIPRLGITLNTLALTANIERSGVINIIGQIHAGSSLLNLKGQLALMTQGLAGAVTLTGQNILVMNTPSYKIYASPNLTIKREDTGYSINGRIDIPTATINSPNFGGNDVLSSDVQFYQPNQASNTTTIFVGDINLTLGNNVQINMKGLSGQLIGGLDIRFNTAAATTATGTLAVQNGIYSAYGQNLTVSTGEIIFTGGPINNPGIELVGSKTILATPTAQNSTLGQNFSLPSSYSAGQSIKVGISLSGTLQHYTVNLFSDPAVYSQSDILSFILTGKSADSLSGNNAQLLLKAASAFKLGNNTVGNITQQLQQFFGLDQLGIGSQNYLANGTPTQTTALTVGKHLTPRLSISYSIGLLDPVSIFLANYDLTKNWSLQGNASSQDNGADIFYNIEK